MREFLEELTEKSVQRCPDFGHNLEDWNILEWAGAVAGEAGEFANVAKKIRRGDFNFVQTDNEITTPMDGKIELGKEAADILCYLILACKREGIDLMRATIDKFNDKSMDIGSDIFLQPRSGQPWALRLFYCLGDHDLFFIAATSEIHAMTIYENEIDDTVEWEGYEWCEVTTKQINDPVNEIESDSHIREFILLAVGSFAFIDRPGIISQYAFE